MDLHVYGAVDNRLFFKPEHLKHFLRHGETSILATSPTSLPYADMMQGIRNIKDLVDRAGARGDYALYRICPPCECHRQNPRPRRHPPPHYAHTKDISFNELGRVSGSKLTLDQACRNIMSHTNCGIAQAFLMASTNTSRVIGMDAEIGSAAPGKIADLVFVDDRFNVHKVMMSGEFCCFDD